MTNKHADIWDRIAEQRANYEAIIAKATETIATARKLIADAREGLDALPVAKVRRPRKQGDDVNAEEVPASEIIDYSKLPGSAELFPQGIERTGGKP